MSFSLIILAGGKSSRMGTDKGLLSFKGTPMIQHVIDTSFWMKQFGYNKEEVEEIKTTCEVAGI